MSDCSKQLERLVIDKLCDRHMKQRTTKPTIRLQSTLVISKSKGLSEILRDIRSSTYQVCRIEEKII